jgi:hypothetical protein
MTAHVDQGERQLPGGQRSVSTASGAAGCELLLLRSPVHPLSNLVASEHIRKGDLIQVDFEAADGILTFSKEAEDIPGYDMVQMIGSEAPFLLSVRGSDSEGDTRQANSGPSNGVFKNWFARNGKYLRPAHLLYRMPDHPPEAAH